MNRHLTFNEIWDSLDHGGRVMEAPLTGPQESIWIGGSG